MKNIKKIAASLLALPVLMATSYFAQAQSSSGAAAQGKTELLWFGQAGFRIKTPEG